MRNGEDTKTLSKEKITLNSAVISLKCPSHAILGYDAMRCRAGNAVRTF